MTQNGNKMFWVISHPNIDGFCFNMDHFKSILTQWNVSYLYRKSIAEPGPGSLLNRRAVIFGSVATLETWFKKQSRKLHSVYKNQKKKICVFFITNQTYANGLWKDIHSICAMCTIVRHPWQRDFAMMGHVPKIMQIPVWVHSWRGSWKFDDCSHLISGILRCPY